MHTRKDTGIDGYLAEDLHHFAWIPPLTMGVDDTDIYLAGPETMTLEKFDEVFAELDSEAPKREMMITWMVQKF